jgi:hypothetical protein
MSQTYTIDEQAITTADRALALREMPSSWRLAVLMQNSGYNRGEIVAALAQAGITRNVPQLIDSAVSWWETGVAPVGPVAVLPAVPARL